MNTTILLCCPFCRKDAVRTHNGLNDDQKKYYGDEKFGCLECDIWFDTIEQWNNRYGCCSEWDFDTKECMD